MTRLTPTTSPCYCWGSARIARSCAHAPWSDTRIDAPARNLAQRDVAGALAALALAEAEGYVRLFVHEGAPMAELLRRAQARGSAPAYVTTLLAACSTRVAGGAE